ncbi:beta strand repeat-containing protein [Verrucomicrobiota bacterium sgz303538]
MKAPSLPLASRVDQKPAPSRPALAALAILLLGLGAQPSHAQTSGFNQTGGGPWDYNAAENWFDGKINGLWDQSLVLTAAQTATFAADTTLTTGLNIGYTGNVDLTFRSDGTSDHTLTLGGDITVNPVSNRTLTIGSVTANQGLNVDLGGTSRVFNVTGSRTLTFLNTISNGDFTVTGGGTVRLARSAGAAALSDIEVRSNSLLMFDSSNGGVPGTTRAGSLTLKSGGKLEVRGNASVDSMDTISGAVVIDGSDPRAKSGTNTISSVTVTPNSARNTLLAIGGLERASKGVALFRGTNLGSNPIASIAANSSNIQINGPAPKLVGGGGNAGTTHISIIPWAVGGTSTSDVGSTFVTYTADNGIRPLDTTTEFATAFGNATDNVRLTTSTAIDNATTANSLLLNVGVTLSGSGTLTVTSGAVFLARTTGANSSISANLDFGSTEAVIGYGRGDTISGAIAGSGGLTVYGLRTDESLKFTNAASTYTGDTTVLANAEVSTGFLPSGSRTGDVYVYGNLQLSVAGFNGTINGLFGNGTVSYGNSSVSSLKIGDNNATSTFTGTIAANNNLSISKIGSGTLTFTGDHTYGRATSILGGTLSVATLANGGIASGIGQSTSIASNLIINSGTLRYTGSATNTDRLFQVGQSTSGGTATLDASGGGPVNFTNTGSITFGTVGTVANEQTRSLVLTGNNKGENTLSASIGDNGSSAVSLAKQGAGTWLLTNNNTYTGTTTIDSGTLLVSGSLSGSSAVTVNSTGTLGGSGSVGNVTVNLGGTVSPGIGAGTLTATGLSLETGSKYTFQGGDVIDVNGTLDLNDQWTLSLGTGLGNGGSVILFTYDTLAGIPDLTPVFDLSQLGFTPTSQLSLTDTGSSIVLNGVQAIPEPASAVTLLAGLGILAGSRRFRRGKTSQSA